MSIGKIITLKTIKNILVRFNKLMTVCEQEYYEKYNKKESPEITFYRDGKKHSKEAIDALETLLEEIKNEKSVKSI